VGCQKNAKRFCFASQRKSWQKGRIAAFPFAPFESCYIWNDLYRQVKPRLGHCHCRRRLMQERRGFFLVEGWIRDGGKFATAKNSADTSRQVLPSRFRFPHHPALNICASPSSTLLSIHSHSTMAEISTISSASAPSPVSNVLVYLGGYKLQREVSVNGTYVKPGQPGVFAARNFSKGEILTCYTGEENAAVELQGAIDNQAGSSYVHWRNYLLMFETVDLWERVSKLRSNSWTECEPLWSEVDRQVSAKEPSFQVDGFRWQDDEVWMNPPLTAAAVSKVTRIPITAQQVSSWEEEKEASRVSMRVTSASSPAAAHSGQSEEWKLCRVACPREVSSLSQGALGVTYVLDEPKLTPSNIATD